MVSTRKYILVGTYKENMYPSVCVEAIEKLGINYRIFIILKFKLFFNFFKLIILKIILTNFTDKTDLLFVLLMEHKL